MASTLDLRLLGGFDLRTADGPAAHLVTPRLHSLVARIALHAGVPQARQSLSYLYWPDSSESQARTNLRRLVHELHLAWPAVDRYLDLDGTVLAVRPDVRLSLDVDRFRTLAAAAAGGDRAGVAAAVEVYLGDLLPSVHDEWLIPERTGLRDAFARLLEVGIAAAETAGDLDGALGHVRRLLEHDPLHEPAYRHLMRLAGRRGDRTGVAHAYRACVTALDRQLGVKPSAQTERLYAALLAGDPPPIGGNARGGATPAPPSTPRPVPSTPQMAGDTRLPANPFTYGRPISDPARFIGREREVAQVFSRLLNAEFESTSIVGERRGGKTSLLHHLAHPEVCRGHGLDPGRYTFVYTDLQLVDQEATPERLWRRLLRQLGRACADPVIDSVLAALPPDEPLDGFALADVFDAIEDAGRSIVLLLDEFEHVTANPAFGPDFFYGLRSLAIHHRLALVTASRRELVDLCHSDTIRSSPFFNIFATVTLPPLTDAEAEALLDSALMETGVVFSPEERALARRLAGRQPYLLQIAGHALFAARARGEGSEAAAHEFAAAASAHFADTWRHAGIPERIALAALAALARRSPDEHGATGAWVQGIDGRASHALAGLVRRGMVAERAGRFAMEAGGFGDWILSALASPDGDERVRAAVAQLLGESVNDG